MNPELERLILAYEDFSISKGKDAEAFLNTFETLVDEAMSRCPPGLARETFRKVILKQHRKWVLKRASKSTSIPPKA
jgi:hypothetical protein